MKQSRQETSNGAVDALMSIVQNDLREITEADIQQEFRQLKNAWGSERLVVGTLDQVKPTLTSNLQRIAAEPGFRYFIVYHDESGGNAGVMASFPQSMVPVRMWKAASMVYLCGNRLFR